MHLIKLRPFSLLLSILMPAILGASSIPGIPDGWSDGYVYANGIRIHYYHAVPAPGKPVMVMVHGVTDNGLCWTTLTWKLQSAYDVYMLDARGHGLSDPFTPSDDADTLIKDVVAFIHVMNFEKPILMGHSMGAATVMRVGAEYPDLSKAIIMLDPRIGGRNPGGERGRIEANRAEPASNDPKTSSDKALALSPPPVSTGPVAFNMFAPPEILAKQNNYSFDDLVAKARHQTPKWDLVDCQYWALSKKQYHGPYTGEAWQAMSGSMRTEDALAKITVPALILKADAPADARKAQLEAASVMQKGKLVHIDGAGHNLHHDELQQTMEVLNQFLSSIAQ